MEADRLSVRRIDLHTARLIYKPPPLHTHTHTHTKGSELLLIRNHMNGCSSLQPLRLRSSSAFKGMSGGGRGSHCGSHGGHFLCSPPRLPPKMMLASSSSSRRLPLLPLCALLLWGHSVHLSHSYKSFCFNSGHLETALELKSSSYPQSLQRKEQQSTENNTQKAACATRSHSKGERRKSRTKLYCGQAPCSTGMCVHRDAIIFSEWRQWYEMSELQILRLMATGEKKNAPYNQITV